MALYGCVIVRKLNYYIKLLLTKLPDAVNYFMEENIEQAQDFLETYIPSSLLDLAASGSANLVQGMVKKLLFFSNKKFFLYFLGVSLGTLIVYFLLIWLISRLYKPVNIHAGEVLHILSYRSFTMAIPMGIGVAASFILFPLGFIPMLVAIIFGCCSIYRALSEYQGKGIKTGLITIAVFIMGEGIRIQLYLAFGAYIFPTILPFGELPFG